MDDSDTTAILPDDELSYKNDETSANDSFNHQNEAEEERNSLKPPFSCPLSVSVEPVLFLSMFSVALQMPLSTQYLWDRISEDLGYNGSRAGGCGNTSGIPDPLEKEVETMTAHWNLYINLGGFAVGLFVVTLLGSWSDLRGRRPVLILPNLGMALQASVYLLVMYLKLPVAWFLLGRLLSGLSGDFNAILAGCFAYVADTSDRGSRTFRVAVLEACLGLAGMLASIIGGQWRKAQGYKNPFWLVLAINLATALYAYLFVPESVTLDPSAKLFTPRHHRAVYRLYSTGGSTSQGDGKSHRYKLWLYTLCFFIVVTVHFGSRELFVLYELSAPLCWGSALIGYGSAAQHLTYMSSLLGLKVMQRCLEDSWVALVGLASNMAGLVVISVANTTVLMFTGNMVLERVWGMFPCHGIHSSPQVKVVQVGGPFRTRGSVCLCSLCGGAVFSGGQRCLQLSLPSHPARHEGLPLHLRCHPPPHPNWGHGGTGVKESKKKHTRSFNNILTVKNRGIKDTSKRKKTYIFMACNCRFTKVALGQQTVIRLHKGGIFYQRKLYTPNLLTDII